MSLPLLMACSMPILTSPALSRDEVVVEQWGQWEGVFPGPAAGNPFVDTTFKVAFTAPSHETTVVRGFYDGGGRYKVRYMPPAVGKWSYKTTSNVAELDGEVGTFEVTRAGGHIHGPVVVAKKNSTKFAYADGAPIFVVATTVYGLFINSSATLSTLKTAPFNKFESVYEPLNGTAGDPTRFNVKFWQEAERVIQAMLEMNIETELILFGNGAAYPAGLACLGGTDPKHYNTTLDNLYLQYAVARLASFRNVWWSMANEWNQYACKWQGAGNPSPCPNQRDYSDPGCGVGGSNSPALTPTLIWDELFQTVHSEDPSNHLLSIHNNGYLYNYSQPWVSHFSIQHTHNKPKDLWSLYGRKPFMYDEIKYEGRLGFNWGSLSAPQMVQRFWWAAAAGAYGMHGEMLYKCPYWSNNAGHYCGESVDKIAWFKDYMLNTTLHPPFEDCEGDDDGYVHTLTCGTDFLMFHFYNGHPNASAAFQYIYLPKTMRNRQDLLQPWEKIITLVYKPPPAAAPAASSAPASSAASSAAASGVLLTSAAKGSPPPPGSQIFGPVRDTKYWEPVGILVDEDTVPHILTFTSCDYKNACARDDDGYSSAEGSGGRTTELLDQEALLFKSGAYRSPLKKGFV